MVKKVATFLLLCILVASLSSCTDHGIYCDSLQEYRTRISKHDRGYSSSELDLPKYFLPSSTFLFDFEYLDGMFHLYENDLFFKYPADLPSVSILVLRYDEDIYDAAKAYMLESIPSFDGMIYEYGDYKFYRNKNFLDSFVNIPKPVFPGWFTMACYNDSERILCFIGSHNDADIDDKYFEDTLGNWKEYIDYAYGRFYNFETHEVQEVENPKNNK